MVDLARLRRDRLGKVQREMAARQIGALVLTDIINIRYCTGVAVMPLWTAVNSRTTSSSRSPAIRSSSSTAAPSSGSARSGRTCGHRMFWQARVTDADSPGKAAAWARQIKDVLAEKGLAGERIGIDVLDYNGYAALQALGLAAHGRRPRDVGGADHQAAGRGRADAADPARWRKTALADMEQAIRPGISENELLAIFWHRVLAQGGEHCFTRLIVSGHEDESLAPRGGRQARGARRPRRHRHGHDRPEGYVADFLAHLPVRREGECGAEGGVQGRPRFRAGLLGADPAGTRVLRFRRALPALPAAYREQAYGVILHGIGVDDESPNIPLPGDPYTEMPEGEFKENMVLAVECYAGKVGAQGRREARG